MITNFDDAAIATLNLDPIKVKLTHRSGENWSCEHADAVEVEYRRFLFLMKKFPNEVTAPMVDVDTFWHYHILDTMKYAADCESVFGYFLHHFQYYGMRGEEDFAALAVAGNRMNELYAQTFGTVQFAGTATAESVSGSKGGAPVNEPMPAGKQAAFCLATAQTAQAAFCLATPQASQAAFCLATAQDQQAAFCLATAEAAFCLATTQTVQAAFCLATAQPAPPAQAAFCLSNPQAADERMFIRPAYSSSAQKHAASDSDRCVN